MRIRSVILQVIGHLSVPAQIEALTMMLNPGNESGDRYLREVEKLVFDAPDVRSYVLHEVWQLLLELRAKLKQPEVKS